VLTSILFVTSSGLVALQTVTFTYRSAKDGDVTFTFEERNASGCIYDQRIKTLTCTSNVSYKNVTDVWTNEPASIKYLKMNCLQDGGYRNQCFCKNGTTTMQQFEVFRPCQLYRLDLDVLANLTSLEALDLSYNEIEIIQNEALAGLSNLKYIAFHNNRIKTLPTGLFCGSPNLEYLGIGNNKLDSYPYRSLFCKSKLRIRAFELQNCELTTIPDNALDLLPSLDRLDVSFNRLATIQKRAFSGGEALMELNLSNCNISYLFPYFCDYLSKMKTLYLQNNNFNNFDFEEIDNCTALNLLNISGNNIINVTGLGVGLNSLTHVDFSFNKIANLKTTFDGLSAMQELHLNNNDIKQINVGQFNGASSLQHLKLSNNLISDISNFSTAFTTKTLQGIHLSKNMISSIPNGAFANMDALGYLDLSDNRIAQIKPASFSGMTSLSELNMGGNVLNEIQNATFTELTNLSFLNLSNNQLTSLPGGAFQGLQTLKTLDLSLNGITKLIADVTSPLKTLKFLSVARNGLTTIETQNWPPLQTLLLQENKLSTVPSDIVFANMAHFNASFNELSTFFGNSENLLPDMEAMESMDLSHNKLTDISPILFQSFYNLTYLNLENNLLKMQLSNETFPNAKYLKELNLANNDDMTITAPLFTPTSFVSLEFLNLSSCNVDELLPLSSPTFAGSSVKSIDLSSCKLKTISPTAFTGLPRLGNVNLTRNQIETFPPFYSGGWTIYDLRENPVTCSCNMTWLAQHSVNVGNNNVTVANFLIPKCRVYTEDVAYFPQSLRRNQFLCPEVASCHVNCACFKHDQNGDVHVVKCRNSLTEIPTFLPTTALSVFLDGNSFSEPSSLDPLINWTAMPTVELYLNQSGIQIMTPEFLKPFEQLEVLSLANNNLVRLHTGFFRSNTLLKQIYLQGNNIHFIESAVFINLPSLQELDISNNSLAVLNVATVHDLLTLESMKYYFLANNPWVCNCSNIAFKEFVDQEKFKIRDRRTLGCDKGREILSLPKSSFTCSVGDSSILSSKSGLVVGIIIVVAVFLLLMTVCCYFRRELLSLCFYKTGLHIPGKKRVAGKHFDILLNYDPADEQCSEYVQHKLLPKLKNNSFSMQTSQDVIQDIEVTKKLLEDSRCSIFIVDKNFVSNTFLLQVFMEANKIKRGHKVILIIIGDIDLSNLDPEMMSYMRRGNYITARSRLWWERLVYELPDPTSGFRPRADTTDGEDVIVFSSLPDDQYEQI